MQRIDVSAEVAEAQLEAIERLSGGSLLGRPTTALPCGFMTDLGDGIVGQVGVDVDTGTAWRIVVYPGGRCVITEWHPDGTTTSTEG